MTPAIKWRPWTRAEALATPIGSVLGKRLGTRRTTGRVVSGDAIAITGSGVHLLTPSGLVIATFSTCLIPAHDEAKCPA